MPKAKPKKKTKKLARKPLTISIHGDAIDIDAEIRDESDLSLFAELISRKMTSPGPMVADPSNAPSLTPNEQAIADEEIMRRMIRDASDEQLKLAYELIAEESRVRADAETATPH